MLKILFIFVFIINLKIVEFANVKKKADGEAQLNLKLETEYIKTGGYCQSKTPRGYGGKKTTGNSWLFLVKFGFVGKDNQTRECEGTLLLRNWIVTSGSCLKDLPPGRNIVLKLGKESCLTDTTIYRADEVFIHPNFSSKDTDINNNVGLIYLQSKLSMRHSHVISAKLGNGKVKLGKRCVIGTWIHERRKGKLRINPYEIFLQSEQTTSKDFTVSSKIPSFPSNVSYNESKFSLKPSKISPNLSKISSDPSKVSSDPSKISSNPSKISSNPSKISSRPSKMSSNPSKMSSNPSKTSSNPSKISSHPSKISSHSSKISSHSSKISSYPSKISSHSSKISSHPSKMSSNPSKMSNPSKISSRPSKFPTKHSKATVNLAVKPAKISKLPISLGKKSPIPSKISINSSKISHNPTIISINPSKASNPSKTSTKSNKFSKHSQVSNKTRTNSSKKNPFFRTYSKQEIFDEIRKLEELKKENPSKFHEIERFIENQKDNNSEKESVLNLDFLETLQELYRLQIEYLNQLNPDERHKIDKIQSEDLVQRINNLNSSSKPTNRLTPHILDSLNLTELTELLQWKKIKKYGEILDKLNQLNLKSSIGSKRRWIRNDSTDLYFPEESRLKENVAQEKALWNHLQFDNKTSSYGMKLMEYIDKIRNRMNEKYDETKKDDINFFSNLMEIQNRLRHKDRYREWGNVVETRDESNLRDHYYLQDAEKMGGIVPMSENDFKRRLIGKNVEFTGDYYGRKPDYNKYEVKRGDADYWRREKPFSHNAPYYSYGKYNFDDYYKNVLNTPENKNVFGDSKLQYTPNKLPYIGDKTEQLKLVNLGDFNKNSQKYMNALLDYSKKNESKPPPKTNTLKPNLISNDLWMSKLTQLKNFAEELKSDKWDVSTEKPTRHPTYSNDVQLLYFNNQTRNFDDSISNVKLRGDHAKGESNIKLTKDDKNINDITNHSVRFVKDLNLYTNISNFQDEFIKMAKNNSLSLSSVLWKHLYADPIRKRIQTIMNKPGSKTKESVGTSDQTGGFNRVDGIEQLKRVRRTVELNKQKTYLDENTRRIRESLKKGGKSRTTLKVIKSKVKLEKNKGKNGNKKKKKVKQRIFVKLPKKDSYEDEDYDEDKDDYDEIEYLDDEIDYGEADEDADEGGVIKVVEEEYPEDEDEIEDYEDVEESGENKADNEESVEETDSAESNDLEYQAVAPVKAKKKKKGKGKPSKLALPKKQTIKSKSKLTLSKKAKTKGKNQTAVPQPISGGKKTKVIHVTKPRNTTNIYKTKKNKSEKTVNLASLKKKEKLPKTTQNLIIPKKIDNKQKPNNTRTVGKIRRRRQIVNSTEQANVTQSVNKTEPKPKILPNKKGVLVNSSENKTTTKTYTTTSTSKPIKKIIPELKLSQYRENHTTTLKPTGIFKPKLQRNQKNDIMSFSLKDLESTSTTSTSKPFEKLILKPKSSQASKSHTVAPKPTGLFKPKPQRKQNSDIISFSLKSHDLESNSGLSTSIPFGKLTLKSEPSQTPKNHTVPPKPTGIFKPKPQRKQNSDIISFSLKSHDLESNSGLSTSKPFKLTLKSEPSQTPKNHTVAPKPTGIFKPKPQRKQNSDIISFSLKSQDANSTLSTYKPFGLKSKSSKTPKNQTVAPKPTGIFKLKRKRKQKSNLMNFLRKYLKSSKKNSTSSASKASKRMKLKPKLSQKRKNYTATLKPILKMTLKPKPQRTQKKQMMNLSFKSRDSSLQIDQKSRLFPDMSIHESNQENSENEEWDGQIENKESVTGFYGDIDLSTEKNFDGFEGVVEAYGGDIEDKVQTEKYTGEQFEASPNIEEQTNEETQELSGIQSDVKLEHTTKKKHKHKKKKDENLGEPNSSSQESNEGLSETNLLNKYITKLVKLKRRYKNKKNNMSEEEYVRKLKEVVDKIKEVVEDKEVEYNSEEKDESTFEEDEPIELAPTRSDSAEQIEEDIPLIEEISEDSPIDQTDINDLPDLNDLPDITEFDTNDQPDINEIAVINDQSYINVQPDNNQPNNYNQPEVTTTPKVEVPRKIIEKDANLWNFSINRVEPLETFVSGVFEKSVTIIDPDVCKKIFKDKTMGNHIICTSATTENAPNNYYTLNRDCGGPLICDGELVGIHSIGKYDNTDSYEVFMKMSHYGNWVRKVVSESYRSMGDSDEYEYEEYDDKSIKTSSLQDRILQVKNISPLHKSIYKETESTSQPMKPIVILVVMLIIIIN